MTFSKPDAEELLLTVLEDGSVLAPPMEQRIEEVFSPIFFYYPKGLQDHSVWEPCDPGNFIRRWREIAALREYVDIDANNESTAGTAPQSIGLDASNKDLQALPRGFQEDFVTRSVRPDVDMLHKLRRKQIETPSGIQRDRILSFGR